MINRRCKRCCCMNNFINNNQDNIETACNNISSNSQTYNDNCSCGFDEDIDVFPSNPRLGQSYVPFQYMEDTFKPRVGLDNGTIFPELVSPYSPGVSMKEIAFIEETNNIGEGCNSCQ